MLDQIDYNNPVEVKKLLGSFWFDFFDEPKQFELFILTLLTLMRQYGLDTTQLVESISVQNIPTTSKVDLKKIKIYEDDIFHNEDFYTLNDNLLNGVIRFNQVKTPEDKDISISLENVINASFLMDKPINATRYMVGNRLDFYIDNGRLHFLKNPFEYFNHKYDKKGLYIDLYLKILDIDTQNIQKTFGTFLNFVVEQSTDEYKQAVKVVWEALTRRTTENTFRQYISAITGAPVITGPGSEEVVEIVDHENEKIVVTDSHVYFIDNKAKIIVDKQQKLDAGDSLSDSVLFYVNKEILSSNIPAITTRQWIDGEELCAVFYNKLVPVNKKLVNGKVVCSFTVSNNKTINQKFWDFVDKNCNVLGINSASLFRRDGLTDLNTLFLSDVLDEINPVEFFLNFVTSTHVHLVVINQNKVKTIPNKTYMSYLSKIMPPDVFIVLAIIGERVLEYNHTTDHTFTGLQLPSDEVLSFNTQITHKVDLFYVE